MIKDYVTPNDVSGATDSERIQNAVNLAKEKGYNSVVIPRINANGKDYYEITKAIRLPSDITVYLDNCRLVTPKDVACNFFCNETYDTPDEQELDKEQHDINIIGLGNAMLDGGEYNGLSESNSGKEGRPSIRENSMLMFTNCRYITIKNLKTRRHRWWAFCFAYCNHVHISDIDFQADFTYVDKDGIRRFDRTAREEYECYVKNADGIDLRNGCNFFTIENITGKTEDDSIALTTLQGSWHNKFVKGKDDDIHDVVIKNIQTDCLACGNIRLTCADGNKVYNIVIDGVYDMAEKDCGYASGGTIKINDSYYRYTRISSLGEMYNISVNNVYSKSKVGAVMFQQTANNVSISNVFMENPNAPAVLHHKGYGYLRENNGPFDYENISISNVFYSEKPKVEYAVDFRGCNAKGVKVANVPDYIKTITE